MTTGKTAEEIMDPSETYLVIRKMSKNVPTHMSAATGKIDNPTPKNVATPFPPLNPR